MLGARSTCVYSVVTLMIRVEQAYGRIVWD
jgi:hypothetical protein